ncbi:MAG: prolipoprotein diacylglyceryl transferase [Verrucomicrobia bacterium]|nr:prolipoprotein diacylglyceryl transferase [Verrucomicrobiota bacterium]
MHFELRYTAYGWLMLIGIVASVWMWSRLTRRDDRLVVVYVAALVGAFLGAKLIYLLAEGWLDWPRPDRWQRLATGKTILGGLLGGYLSVELAKRWIGYRGITGDWFGLITPIGILFGRVGCYLHGCCPGQTCEPSWFTVADAFGESRWPAVPMEMLFNAAAMITVLILRRKQALVGQHFHVYLIAYGLFRFAHEFLRDTPRVGLGLSGYHGAALAVTMLGVTGYVRRSANRGVAIQAQKIY